MQQVVLSLADAPAGSCELTPWLEAHLENIYGVAHPDPAAELAPFVEATYQAVIGTPGPRRSVDPSYVDPAFAQQLRHTLNLDGRPPAGRPGGPPDVQWDIGHEWKLPPPRKAKLHAKKGAKTSAKTSARSRSALRAKRTRLDRLEAIVRAARVRQRSRDSADEAADVGSW